MKRIEPARVATAPDGGLYAPGFDDVYASRAGALEQARHVFLAGNDLPARWAGRRTSTVLELGFGAGINFLATWDAWTRHGSGDGWLHYVSIEAFPLRREDLAAALRPWPALAPHAQALLAAWPPLVTGVHRLRFDAARLTLTLVLRDVEEALPQLRLAADSLYLDGFAPRKNDAMWSPAVLRGLARLAAPGATFATWCAAGQVRRDLTAAGFEVESRPGFGGKREMTLGRLAPRPRPRARTAWRNLARPPGRALVAGAGIAGASVARVLAERGWQVDLLETASGVAAGASGNLVGHVGLHVSPDDALLSRLTRAGLLSLARRCEALEAAGHAVLAGRGAVVWREEPCTVPEDLHALLAPIAPEEAAARVGCLPSDGPSGLWWSPAALSLRPLRLVTALIDHPGITLHTDEALASLQRQSVGWSACTRSTRTLDAEVVVLANGLETARFVPGADAQNWPVGPVAGQVTHLPATLFAPGSVSLNGLAYLLPPAEGLRVCGATYEVGAGHPRPSADAHRRNLQKLAAMLSPDDAARLASLDPEQLRGRVGVRAVPRDRLPMAGPAPDFPAAAAIPAQVESGGLRALPRQPGLFVSTGLASRGFAWALLAAEIIADQLEGAPLGMEGDLVDALDPGRFAVRALRSSR